MLGQQPDDGLVGNGLAATTFAHDAQRFTGKQIERNAIDGGHHPTIGFERRLQVANLQDRVFLRSGIVHEVVSVQIVFKYFPAVRFL